MVAAIQPTTSTTTDYYVLAQAEAKITEAVNSAKELKIAEDIKRIAAEEEKEQNDAELAEVESTTITYNPIKNDEEHSVSKTIRNAAGDYIDGDLSTQYDKDCPILDTSFKFQNFSMGETKTAAKTVGAQALNGVTGPFKGSVKEMATVQIGGSISAAVSGAKSTYRAIASFF